MSTAPTIPSNSSSASIKLNWQPSQEANLKTAIFGLDFALGFCFVLELMLLQQRPELLVGENRPILANEVRSVLAMSAESDAALHVSFHGEKDVRAGESVGFEFAGDKTHHDLKPADHGRGTRRLEPGVLEQRGHHADMPAPSQTTVIDRDQHLSVALAGPGSQFLAVKQIARAARSVEDYYTPVRLA